MSDFMMGSLHLSFVSLSWFQKYWLGSTHPKEDVSENDHSLTFSPAPQADSTIGPTMGQT